MTSLWRIERTDRFWPRPAANLLALLACLHLCGAAMAQDQRSPDEDDAAALAQPTDDDADSPAGGDDGESPPAEAPAPADATPASAPAGMTAEQLYIDFVHFVMIGRYDIASAYGKNLLEHPDATPAGLLDTADKQQNSREALIWAVSNQRVGALAQAILDRIAEGERERRRDAQRIVNYIEGLGGGIRAEINNADRLRESGEYAVPWMIAALRDPKRTALHPRIIRTLPKIGKAAVNPLVAALDTTDAVLQQTVIRALAEIGYPQAVPYIKRILESPASTSDSRDAALAAVARIVPATHPLFSMNAAEAFTWLAGEYYDRTESIRADVREPMTNVWFWRDDFLTPTPVPTRIYEEVMCMRCGEAALMIDADATRAVALWLAANFRREARLGMDVESEELDPRNSADGTRPPGFLRGVYYARSAGPRYCHPVLGLAVRDREAAVALGALAALQATAGAGSLVGLQDDRLPLVDALTFPDTTVRIKAALALGQALPLEKFPGGENVTTVLAEALAQTGRRHAIVVDTDGENRNRVAGILAGMDVAAVTGSNLLEVLAIARADQPDVDLIVLASDISQPNLAEAAAVLRRDFRFANTPVLVLARREQELLADRIAAAEVQMSVVPHRAAAADVARAWDEAASRVGRIPTTPESALALALDAAETLRLIAVSRTPAFDFAKAEPALIAALNHPAAELQIKAAQVLAYASSAAAQRAVARVALTPDTDLALRLPAFASLAESAKRQGNLLESYEVDALRELTMKSDDPIVKTAASRALGALNLPTRDATTIIIGSTGS